MLILRTIIRFVLVVAGLICILDGLLNAYRLYSLRKIGEVYLSLPIPGPFSRMGIGVVLIAVGLIASGVLGRIAVLKQKTPSP